METESKLMILPIAHTYADMGSLRNKIPFDNQYEAVVTGYWVTIFRYLNNLSLELVSCLQVYQDSLPNTSEEIVHRIVDETNTANYDILRTLRDKGASIIGIEDPYLLIEEHQSLQAILNSPSEISRKESQINYTKKSFWLLEERDQYIAKRIRMTLPEEGTGLLFIGAAHDVGSLLKNEIQVFTPEIISRALPKVLRNFYALDMEVKKDVRKAI